MVPAPAWLRAVPGGATIAVHARPGAKRSGLAGLHGNALAVRLAARPVEGAANRALVELFAALLAIPAGRVSLVAGARGREKRLHVDGMDASTIADRLTPLLQVDTARGGA